MQNAVYSVVSEALGRLVSARAADNMLRVALRDAQLRPETVTAQEMQRVLAGPLANRLTTIMSPERAKRELSSVARRLQEHDPKAPTLFPESSDPAPEAAPAPSTLSGAETAEAPSAAPMPSVVLEWNAEALNEPTAPAAPPVPAPPLLSWDDSALTGTPAQAPAPAPQSSAFSWDDQSAGTALQSATWDASALDATLASAAQLEADDFEFEDPGADLPDEVSWREYDLRLVEQQDLLLSDLARFDGVQGVLLCDEGGQVLRSRMTRGAGQLGAVMAATAMMLRSRPWRIMWADLGGQTVYIRPLGRHYVALLAGSHSNLGRLTLELSTLKETA